MCPQPIGLVINPKLKVPLLVLWDDSTEISIHTLSHFTPVGSGEYECCNEEYLKAAHATGYPRVHTPTGVKPRGMGYGTSLYTALCLGAHQEEAGNIRIDSPVLGDGISSDKETRSQSADQWWSRARRIGLTEQISETTSEDIELDHHDLSDCDLWNRNGYAELWRAVATRTMTVEADFYSFDNAWDSDNVLSGFARTEEWPDKMGVIQYMKSITELRKAIKKGRVDLNQTNTIALAACNVSKLSPIAVNFLVEILRTEDADKELVDALEIRGKMHIDAPEAIQKKFSFKKNADAAFAVAVAEELRKHLDWERLSVLP